MECQKTGEFNLLKKSMRNTSNRFTNFLSCIVDSYDFKGSWAQ